MGLGQCISNTVLLDLLHQFHTAVKQYNMGPLNGQIDIPEVELTWCYTVMKRSLNFFEQCIIIPKLRYYLQLIIVKCYRNES